MVTNVTRGVTYYLPQSGASYIGTYASPVLTLVASTGSHSDSDALEIFYDDGVSTSPVKSSVTINVTGVGSSAPTLTEETTINVKVSGSSTSYGYFVALPTASRNPGDTVYAYLSIDASYGPSLIFTNGTPGGTRLVEIFGTGADQRLLLEFAYDGSSWQLKSNTTRPPLHANGAASGYFWSGATSSTWATAGNWFQGAAPTSDITSHVAIFAKSSYSYQPTTGTTSVSGIVIGNGSAALTLTAAGLTVGANGIRMLLGAAASSFTGSLIASGNQTWSNDSASTLTLGTVTGATTGPTLITLGGTGTISSGSVISDSASTVTSLAYAGTGTFTTSAAHTFTGALTVYSGTVTFTGSGRAGNGAGLFLAPPLGTTATVNTVSGSGTVNVLGLGNNVVGGSSAALALGAGTTTTASSVTTSLTCSGAGNLILSGTTISASTATGTWTIPADPGGNVTINGSQTWTAFVGNLATARTVSVAGGQAYKYGGTTCSLSLNNTNTGAGVAVAYNHETSTLTTATYGSLSGSIATPSSGTNTLTHNLCSGGQTINQTVSGTFSGVLADAGASTQFILGSSSTAVLTLAGVNTYTGATTVGGSAGSALRVTGSLAAGSAVTVNSGGTLQGTGTIGGSLTIANSATATLEPGNGGVGTLTVNGALTLQSSSVLTIHTSGTTGSRVTCNSNMTVDGAANFPDALSGAASIIILSCTGTLTNSTIVMGTNNTGRTFSGFTVNTGSSPKTVTAVFV